MKKTAITYANLQAADASANAARLELLDKVADLQELGYACIDILTLVGNVIRGTQKPGMALAAQFVVHKDKLDPLVNTLGFTIQPSPTVIDGYVLEVKGA